MIQIIKWDDQKHLESVKKIYAKDLTNEEFLTFVGIGKSTGLNPFLREIWAVKYGNKDASIFIGRDGYRKSAQSNKDYDYHMVDAVYENDNFEVQEGIVKHTYNLKQRGKLTGAYCIVQRKGSSKPMFTYVELKEYLQSYGVWTSKPATMIKKVAEAQGLRQAFQELFAGTYDESENWEQEQTPSSTPKKQPQKTTETSSPEVFYQKWYEYIQNSETLQKLDENVKVFKERLGKRRDCLQMNDHLQQISQLIQDMKFSLSEDIQEGEIEKQEKINTAKKVVEEVQNKEKSENLSKPPEWDKTHPENTPKNEKTGKTSK